MTEEKKQSLPDGDNMPRELPPDFGWQDDDIVVLYDDDGNRISEEEWFALLDRKARARASEREKAGPANPFSSTT